MNQLIHRDQMALFCGIGYLPCYVALDLRWLVLSWGHAILNALIPLRCTRSCIEVPRPRS